MTRHLLRLIWNRKRHNLLLSIEILCSFVVLFAVAVLGLTFWNSAQHDLGYRIDDVWRVQITRTNPDAERQQDSFARLRRALAALRALPQVRAAATLVAPPFQGWDCSVSGTLTDGRDIEHGCNSADDDLAALMEVAVVDGRWFTREDDAARDTPVVINERLARVVFPDSSPIGRTMPIEYHRPPGLPPIPQGRVVGVIRDFRLGTFEMPRPYLFGRVRLEPAGPGASPLPSFITIRVAPGTTADFEETVLAALRPIAPDWAFAVAALSEDQARMMRAFSAGFWTLGVVLGFLVVMVALGLTGIVWQNVTERMREFGLRRAHGADRGTIRRQVLLELTILASMAILPGVLLAVQIPALPLPPDTFPDARIVFSGLGLAIVALYAIVLSCGWYPSRLATTIQPADALHYE